MQIRTVKEIALHLESFRNIELWYQGIYCLRVTVYYEEKGRRVFAQPYALSENTMVVNSTESRVYDSQIVHLSTIDKK